MLLVAPSLLPKNAFLPGRQLSAQEHKTFVDRRDALFALCTPGEQRCLMRLAQYWHEARPRNLLGPDSIFARSFLADFHHRYLPFTATRPSAVVRGLANVHRVMTRLERWRDARFQIAFGERLQSVLDGCGDEVVLGVPYLLRKLPLEGRPFGSSGLAKLLDAVIEQRASDGRFPAAMRFEAVRRCIQQLSATAGHPGEEVHADLRKHSWRLLLDVANEDMSAAIRFVDEHWTQRRGSEVLMALHLHEMPELAYKLAVKFKPFRIEFAADMLQESIFYASFELEKLEGASAAALEKVMDASCRLLADWTTEVAQLNTLCALRSIGRLLQFGNPSDGYWKQVPPMCLAIIKGLTPADRGKQLRLLAQTVFYAEDASSVSDDALGLFETSVARRFGEGHEGQRDVWGSVFDVCSSLSIVENKTLSFRNRRISPNPEHRLVQVLDRQVGAFLDRAMAGEPSLALQHLVSVATGVQNEKLIRKYVGVLSEQFPTRARQFPDDAGRALKRLVQHCGHSQVDDQMYRKLVWREAFDALLPVLEGISAADAAVARNGIGWSPRGDI